MTNLNADRVDGGLNERPPIRAPRHREGGSSRSLPRQSRRSNLTDKKLVDIASKQLVKPLDLSDSTVAGLTARVAPGGRIAFYFRWRAGSGFRRVRLSASTVEEARRKAIEARSATAIGRDPRGTPAAHDRKHSATVAEIARDYLGSFLPRGRSEQHRRNTERVFERHIFPELGRVRLVDITKQELTALFRRVSATKSAKGKGTGKTLATMANRVHTIMGGLMRWAVAEGRLPPGAAVFVAKPVVEEPSARALREETKVLLRPVHMALLWAAVEEEEQPHVRALVRMLCLLPMRREEITRLAWHEVRGLFSTDDDDGAGEGAFAGPRLELPAARMKGRRPQTMPLPPAAVDLLRKLHAVKGVGDYVFSVSAGRKPYAGWKQLAARLREACPELPAGWVVHDIRSGISTAMGDNGEDEAIISRLLHHAPSTRIGVTAIYERSRRHNAMLAALERWERTLLGAIRATEC